MPDTPFAQHLQRLENVFSGYDKQLQLTFSKVGQDILSLDNAVGQLLSGQSKLNRSQEDFELSQGDFFRGVTLANNQIQEAYQQSLSDIENNFDLRSRELDLKIQEGYHKFDFDATEAQINRNFDITQQDIAGDILDLRERAELSRAGRLQDRNRRAIEQQRLTLEGLNTQRGLLAQRKAVYAQLGGSERLLNQINLDSARNTQNQLLFTQTSRDVNRAQARRLKNFGSSNYQDSNKTFDSFLKNQSELSASLRQEALGEVRQKAVEAQIESRNITLRGSSLKADIAAQRAENQLANLSDEERRIEEDLDFLKEGFALSRKELGAKKDRSSALFKNQASFRSAQKALFGLGNLLAKDALETDKLSQITKTELRTKHQAENLQQKLISNRKRASQIRERFNQQTGQNKERLELFLDKQEELRQFEEELERLLNA